MAQGPSRTQQNAGAAGASASCARLWCSWAVGAARLSLHACRHTPVATRRHQGACRYKVPRQPMFAGCRLGVTVWPLAALAGRGRQGALLSLTSPLAPLRVNMEAPDKCRLRTSSGESKALSKSSIPFSSTFSTSCTVFCAAGVCPRYSHPSGLHTPLVFTRLSSPAIHTPPVVQPHLALERAGSCACNRHASRQGNRQGKRAQVLSWR